MYSNIKDLSLIIERKRLGSPSKLAIIDDCPMRYLYETENCRPTPLESNPSAYIGTAIHNAIEEILKNSSNKYHDYLKIVEANFRKLILEKRSSFVTVWILETTGISGIISRRQLVEQASLAKKIVSRFQTQSKVNFYINQKNKEKIPLGSEKWLESTNIGIAGRADLIYFDNEGYLRVVDFKTGNIYDEDNNPKKIYLIQLAAYAAILEEIQPNTPIRLELIGREANWVGVYNRDIKDTLQLLINKLNFEIPLGREFNELELSKVGEHCAQCSFRPICNPYKISLEQKMQSSYVDESLYLYDLYCEIIEFQINDELLDLRCKLANNKIVKIARIPIEQIPSNMRKVGKKIYCYSLKVSENKISKRFPSNYFVLDTESPRNSAFQAKFFEY